MPALANVRHENFVVAFITSGVASRAYLEAGFAPTTRNALDVGACRLLRTDKVQARIAELRDKMAGRTKITLDSLIANLDEDRALARERGRASTAIRATMAKARLVGLIG